MKFFALIALAFAPAVAASSAPPSATRVPARYASNEQVARLGGGMLLLEQAIQDEVINDSAVKATFDRLGLVAACSIYNHSLDAVIEKNRRLFTQLLADAMREYVPAEVLMGRTVPSLEHAPLIAYRKRILTRLDATAGALFVDSRDELRMSFLSAAGQTDSNGGAGIFADWDLEKPLARRIACFLLSNSPATLPQKKLAFDGFFRRKDQQ